MTLRLRLAVALIALGVVPLSGQASSELPPWRLSWFPYVTASPNDGVMGMARTILFRQAQYDDRVTLRDAVSLEAGYSTHNAWMAHLRGEFPRIADGWRIQGDAIATHQPRFGNPDAEEFARENLSRQSIAAEVTRHLAGALHVALRAGAEHLSDRVGYSTAGSRYPSAPIQTPLCSDDCSPFIGQSDLRARVALVWDRRDREFDTRSGALLQAGAFAGSAGGGYSGYYAIASGWIPAGIRTRFSARAGLRGLSQSSAVGIQLTMPAWEDEFAVLGGVRSHRGLALAEATGRGVLLAGAEVRHDIIRIRNIAALTLIAFADGGRTFRDPATCIVCADPDPSNPGAFGTGSGDLELTLKDWTWSPGVGVAIRVLRNAVLTMTVARANERTRVYVSSGWSW